MILPEKQEARAIVKTARAKNLATTYSRGTFRPTTIGCSGLNGRVRDGNGWDPRHIITRKETIGLSRADKVQGK